MKKLMIAAAASIAAVGAFAAVESPNIVGYGPTTLPASGLSAGPSFVTMSESGVYDLIDIRVVGYTDFSMADVQVQTLTGGGSTDTTYLWYDFSDPDAGTFYGWYNADTFEPLQRGDVTIAVGEGLWSVTAASGLSLQTSGEVATSADVSLELPSSGLTIANPTPATVDLINCYVAGYVDASMADVQVQTLTGGGSTDTTYLWYDFSDPDAGTFYGWYNADTFEPLAANEVTVAPGEGLWSVTAASGLNFNWPKVDL